MKTWYSCLNPDYLKTYFNLSLTVLLLSVCIACSSDDEDLSISLDGPVLSVSDFSGNWNATNAVFESLDGSLRVDIINVGGSATLAVQSNGRFTITLSVPGQASEVISGELGFNGDEYGSSLIVIFDGDARDDYELFNISLNNGVLSLSGQTTFDFLNNGSETPATLDLTLERA